MLRQALDSWTASDASQLYEVPRWSMGYFTVHPNGHLLVHPERNPDRAIDLKELVDRLQMRGVDLPVLLRFNGILKDRLEEIYRAFAEAIAIHEYRSGFSCVYPIKVNQQRQVVSEIVKHGSRLGCGLEAGSKPELLAVVAMSQPETPIVCNGFKDCEFIEMAMLTQKMGRQVIPVIEKYTELDLILHYAEKVGVRPQIGCRVKLATRGSGRWQSSGGYRSKFGLTSGEILSMVEELERRDMLDCFTMLHFHLGSQITNVRRINEAVIEGTRVYADLVRRGAGLRYLDVGGGLGVDYDGSQTNFQSSVNYTLQEYANSVVYHIQSVCDDTGVKQPHILSECGRAIVAYHTVLVFGVLGVAGVAMHGGDQPIDLPDDARHPLTLLGDTLNDLSTRNMIESFHDAQTALDMSMNLFSLGHLPLEQRALAENLFWSICGRIQRLLADQDEIPEELQGLDRMLSETFFCNFSLFQSMPDSWAIKQLFPIMPIHRLDERPSTHAVLGDITCDSDGKIDQFIDRRDVRRTLPLHHFDGSPYYLCATLLGAYQEILGDLHNLFGDANAVHVELNDQGQVSLETFVKGETVSEVLDYVQFHPKDLVGLVQASVEVAVRQGRLSHSEAGHLLRFYEEGLHGYTYLEKMKYERLEPEP